MPQATAERERPLSSLAEWSIEHTRAVFEAPNAALGRRALDATFAPTLTAHLNGAALDFAALGHLVASMRASSPGGLSVEWMRADATPDDPANRGGSLVGEYIIRGIWKRVPGADTLCEFERHKKVLVRIESQSSDPAVDSRIVVQLDIVASDVGVSRT
ncbi:hypothetical protein DFH07DRAFT_415119 [Mycena maculata]|uniref:Uncharacterized protein n=1 Tax=Mycena maculata TaxID=230809 RepID=A0AAD7NI22_9AGAR|nr:hypothetical protein DFH07DRAFT_415119 [Mycena maculata]